MSFADRAKEFLERKSHPCGMQETHPNGTKFPKQTVCLLVLAYTKQLARDENWYTKGKMMFCIAVYKYTYYAVQKKKTMHYSKNGNMFVKLKTCLLKLKCSYTSQNISKKSA